jgi:hypothetical protein
MKSTVSTLALAFILSPAAFAQKWELGGGVGGGFYSSQNITAPSGSAAARFASNLAASGWLANNSGRLLGGEFRYDYQRGAAELSSGGAKATFAAQSQAFHYDFQFHLSPRSSHVRPFVAAGGGVKAYRGTGAEVAYQPLNKIGLLTRTTDTKPLISIGGGIKVKISRGVGLRAEVHDYLTSFPGKVIAPALNASAGGWIHDFVVSFGVSLLAQGPEK